MVGSKIVIKNVGWALVPTFPTYTGVSDIMSHNLTLILGLIWALILRYQMAKGQPDLVESKVGRERKRDVTADELLLGWIRMILPNKNIRNLTSVWNDGQNLSALVEYLKPGLIPNHASLGPKNRLENVRHAMTLAKQHLNIPQVMHPEDLAVDHPDKLSTMTYLSQFWWRSRDQTTSPQQGMLLQVVVCGYLANHSYEMCSLPLYRE